MSRFLKKIGWRPAPGTLVGGIMFIAGFFLTAISWKFLWICAAGTFGPGILRELGWLRDQDEFQRRAARRAGYHAFLVTGLIMFISVGVIRDVAGEMMTGQVEPVVLVFLSLLWFTWMISSMLAYWGPKKMASFMLYAFGIVWLIFNIIANLQDFMAMVMQCLVAVPFFALAFTAKRWPKITGTALLLVSGFAFYFFDLYRIFGPDPLARGRGEVIIFFFGPLFSSGIALLYPERKEEVMEVAQ